MGQTTSLSQSELGAKCKIDLLYSIILNVNNAQPKMQSAKKPAHFPCNKCNYVASYRPHLKRHIKTVHDKIKDFACSLCTFRSGHRESLRKHIQAVHDKIKDATCKYCEYKTSRGDTLKQHVSVRIALRRDGRTFSLSAVCEFDPYSGWCTANLCSNCDLKSV